MLHFHYWLYYFPVQLFIVSIFRDTVFRFTEYNVFNEIVIVKMDLEQMH